MLLKKSFVLKTPYLLKNRNCYFFLRQPILQNHKKYNSTICSYADNPKKRLALIVNEKCVKKIITGYLWVFSNEIKNAEELFLYSPCIVNIKNEFNEYIAVGIYNKNSTICARVLSKDISETIDEHFFEERIRKAYKKRIEIFKNDDFFRVVNAESDFLPGVIIDKYRNVICVQISASGIDILLPLLLQSVEVVFKPETIILKNDSSNKRLEKYTSKKEVYKGVYEGPTELRENGLTFFVDILNGQKTGWYFDQRDNRLMLIDYSKNKNVLDLFSYVGSFGITLAYYGAKKVTCVDSSYSAICNGIRSASYNNVLDKITFVHACVKQFLNISMNTWLNNSKQFTMLSSSTEQKVLNENDETVYDDNCGNKRGELQMENHNIVRKNRKDFISEIKNVDIYESRHMGTMQKWNIMDDINQLLVKKNNVDLFNMKYDVILIDPPPLAKTHCLVAPALKLYQKLLFISFHILKKPGYVFVCSCNRLIGYNELNACVKKSLHWAKCEGVIISEGRISADHPIHVAHPETRYLTSLLLFIS